MIKTARPHFTILQVLPIEKEWVVKHGSGRVASHHNSREAAVERAKQMARGRQPADINVFGKDGKIHTFYRYAQSIAEPAATVTPAKSAASRRLRRRETRRSA